jgi:hypothetical protein
MHGILWPMIPACALSFILLAVTASAFTLLALAASTLDRRSFFGPGHHGPYRER